MAWLGPEDADRLVFIDESGSTVAMTPTYARAPRGERAHDDVPLTSLAAAVERQGAERARFA